MKQGDRHECEQASWAVVKVKVSVASTFTPSVSWMQVHRDGLPQVPSPSAPAMPTGITSHHDGLQKGKINPSLLKCFSQALLFFNNKAHQPARRLVAPGALPL